MTSTITKSPASILLFVILIFTFMSAHHGLVISTKLKSNTFIRVIDSFRFDLYGKVSISGEHSGSSDKSAMILVCNYRQHLEMISDPRSRARICIGSDTSTDCLVGYLNNTEYEFTIPRRDIYSFILVNCNLEDKIYRPVEVGFSISALNPGPSHLPYGLSLLPRGYLALLISYSLLSSFLVISVIRYWKVFTRLHTFYMSLLGLKTLVIGLSFLYWKLYEKSGSKNPSLFYIDGLLSTIAEILLVFLLLLISRGWNINNVGLDPQEFRFVPLPVLFLFLSLTFFSVYNDGYYMMAMIIMYFLTVPKVFTNVSEMIKISKLQLNVIDTFRIGMEYRNVLKTKLLLFKILRATTIVYVILTLGATISRIFVPWYYEWVSILGSEIIRVLMFANVGYLIRLKIFSMRYFNVELFTEEIGEEMLNNPDIMERLRNRTNLLKYDLDSLRVIEWPDRGLSICMEEKRSGRRKQV